MAQIKFVKYNKTRRERFQIKTTILEEFGTRYVEKTALNVEGAPHIWSFASAYTLLSQQHRILQFSRPEISEDRCTVRFPYLEGETLAEALGREIRDGKPPLDAIRAGMNKIYEVSPESLGNFYVTPEFTEVFGEIDALEDQAYAVSDIDTLFENVILTDAGMYCLDYEWVYAFPVPMHFVQYRTLYYFYQKYQSLMHYHTAAEFLTEFEITEEMTVVYQRMELAFQQYVHGENQKIYLENFLVDPKTDEEIMQLEKELERSKEHFFQLQVQLGERDTTIRKMQEVQRLTNNHVTNLEVMIANLRHEADEQGKMLSYLNAHESIFSKLRRMLGRKFNERYPKGSVQRKKLSYLKEYAKHPIRSFRYYTSEEGKNHKDGDFHIGEAYKIHGKLQFKRVDEPEVSIIIPVYNQIAYTYACLVSILQYTTDVSYEVIIADDVSTDATEHLSHYAEGLVICRNTTNQGFLRNCNHAARAARGTYMMFLNNDTQVTEHWLSSLVKLIRSDSSIGMVGSKLVYPDGRLQEAGGIIWSDGSGWNYGRLDDPEKPEYNYVKEADYISGAAILLPVELWKQIGGFDTRFAPAYCEDSDLAFAVRKAGYRVVYQPLSKVIHFEGISNGTDVEGSGLKRYQAANSKKLKEKWAEEFKLQRENNGNPDPFRARERSAGKDIILVIDHYVPTYDRDAGSKTTFQYLKMFLKKGYVVKFLGDNFLHEEPYSTTLQQMGIEILYGRDYQVRIWDWLREHGDDIAFAYLNRPHIAINYIDYIKENTKIKTIYYGHDLHFLREGREYALTGDAEKKQAAEYWKSIEISLMYKADMSYYPSYIERDAIKAVDESIQVKD
ncbi:MAG: glycosyltransferase family 2 protein, partial [Hungatella sp.]